MHHFIRFLTALMAAVVLGSGCEDPSEPQAPITEEHLFDVHGTPDGRVFAVGTLGVVLRNDGDGWFVVEAPDTMVYSAWHGVWVDADGTPFKVGSHEVVNDRTHLRAVWGTGSGSVYAVGWHNSGQEVGYEVRWEGGAQEHIFSEGLIPFGRYQAVWGSSETDIYFGGDVDFYRDDGLDFELIGRHLAHYDGSDLTVVDIPAVSGITGLHGSAADNVVAVGGGGEILRYDGVTWRAEESGVTAPLDDVWVASMHLAYAVGDEGTILRFNGQEWQRMESGTSAFLNGVWGRHENDIHVVGSDGTLLHFDGRAWK